MNNDGFGGRLEYAHALNSWLSAYAGGSISHQYAGPRRVDYMATAGIRGVF